MECFSDFRLSDASGALSDTVEARGKGPLIVAFFRTNCPTCQTAFPFLQRISDRYPGATVLGVSQNSADDTEGFAQAFDIRFPLLLDERLGVTDSFGLQFVPTICCVDASGDVLDTVIGWDRMRMNRLAERIAKITGAAFVEPAPEGVVDRQPG